MHVLLSHGTHCIFVHFTIDSPILGKITRFRGVKAWIILIFRNIYSQNNQKPLKNAHKSPAKRGICHILVIRRENCQFLAISAQKTRIMALKARKALKNRRRASKLSLGKETVCFYVKNRLFARHSPPFSLFGSFFADFTATRTSVFDRYFVVKKLFLAGFTHFNEFFMTFSRSSERFSC